MKGINVAKHALFNLQNDATLLAPLLGAVKISSRAMTSIRFKYGELTTRATKTKL